MLTWKRLREFEDALEEAILRAEALGVRLRAGKFWAPVLASTPPPGTLPDSCCPLGAYALVNYGYRTGTNAVFLDVKRPERLAFANGFDGKKLQDTWGVGPSATRAALYRMGRRFRARYLGTP